MSEKIEARSTPNFELGDRVKIKGYPGKPGKIIELRGAIGPEGKMIYRVLLGRKPVVSHVEVRADQLEYAHEVSMPARGETT